MTKTKFSGLILALALGSSVSICAQSGHITKSLGTRIVPALGAGQSGGSIPSYCTAATPCLEVTGNLGTDIAPTVTTNSSGVETAGPASGSLYLCTVTGTQTCAGSTFSTAAGSPWVLVTLTNGQSISSLTSSTFGPIYITNVAYGQTYNTALTLTWTGALGGQASAATLGNQVAFPAAPAAAPAAPSAITNVVVE